jgi:hypothetical protein
MRNDLELDAIIEDYLLGKLNAQETEAFEQLRLNDATVDHKVLFRIYGSVCRAIALKRTIESDSFRN